MGYCQNPRTVGRVFLLLSLFGVLWAPSFSSAQDNVFICPMDPDVRSHQPGNCRRCGMKLRGIEALVEVHSHYLEEIQIAKEVGRVYDFALSPLVLQALYSGDARCLKEWLAICPRNSVTVLDTQDGIRVTDVGPDRKSPDGPPGLLSLQESNALVETIHQRSNGSSLGAIGPAINNSDIYQVKCTYYEALGRRDDDYLIARAIQFLAPGVPQVYYVGLLAGTNDLNLARRTGEARDINRHCYTRAIGSHPFSQCTSGIRGRFSGSQLRQ
jgi:hypothetical protein